MFLERLCFFAPLLSGLCTVSCTGTKQCCWFVYLWGGVVFVCVWGALLQTEQKTMWGQGLSGLKVTNLLGFSDQQSTEMLQRDGIVKTKRSRICIVWVCRKSLLNGEVGGCCCIKRRRKSLLWYHDNSRSHVIWEQILKDGIALARFPNPHKEKNNTQKRSHNFMHGRTFCSLKKGWQRRLQRGQHLQAKVRSSVFWTSLRDGFASFAFKWINRCTNRR